MANVEHVATLKLGVQAWNRWRLECPDVEPDLRAVDLRGARLGRANFGDARLSGARLSDADLRGADLGEANLIEANLVAADLSGARLGGAHLTRANLADAKLWDADLRGATLVDASLRRANLCRAVLKRAKLGGADLTGARLSDANLGEVDLVNANLGNADLAGANLSDGWLIGVRLTDAMLVGTNVVGADFGETVISNCDLRGVVGLEFVRHIRPSHVSIDTIYRSQGEIPEGFLLGCGVPDSFIAQIPALVGALQPIQFYSCFISYSTNDGEFAKRLHERMRAEKLRVWYSPEDIKGGEKLHEQIERAIQLHDRLLLVLSENSIESPWVVTEIRNARRAEIMAKRRKLFPIRLCAFDTLRGWECFDADFGADLANEVRQYFIPDFSNWKNHDDFEAAFARLLKDLRPPES
jgi:uncharacterized protein YjbI with pentapeptide repeats